MSALELKTLICAVYVKMISHALISSVATKQMPLSGRGSTAYLGGVVIMMSGEELEPRGPWGRKRVCTRGCMLLINCLLLCNPRTVVLNPDLTIVQCVRLLGLLETRLREALCFIWFSGAPVLRTGVHSAHVVCLLNFSLVSLRSCQCLTSFC